MPPQFARPGPRLLPHQARRRRRSRAAALVEALVAIPFFIIIFTSMVYVGQLYGEKQRTLRLAKERAWTHAMRNCEGGSNEVPSQPTGGPFDGTGADQAAVDPYMASDQGTQVFTDSFHTAAAKVDGTVTASNAIGGFTRELSTTTRVECNEEPIDGNLPGVLEYMWDTYKEF